MADEEETILANARKLPLSERVTHKNWKARSEAFDDIRERCEGAFSNDDPVLIEAGTWHFLYPICFHRVCDI